MSAFSAMPSFSVKGALIAALSGTLVIVGSAFAANDSSVSPNKGAQAGSARVIQDYSIDSIRDPNRARAALDATAAARLDYDERWQRQRYDCYQRIAVNNCLDKISSERRLIDAKLRAIDIHSRQIIRNDSLIERNKQEAANRVNGQAAPNSAAAPNPAAAPVSTDRQAQQQERLNRHQQTLAQAKQAAVEQNKRQQERIAALDQKRREHARRLEQGRERAKLEKEKNAALNRRTKPTD